MVMTSLHRSVLWQGLTTPRPHLTNTIFKPRRLTPKTITMCLTMPVMQSNPLWVQILDLLDMCLYPQVVFHQWLTTKNTNLNSINNIYNNNNKINTI